MLDIGGDGTKRRLSCFCGRRIVFLGIDPYENGPACSCDIVRLCDEVALDLHSLCAIWEAKEGRRISEDNHMKRVLLLVCLIVSLVELDWERNRIYLLSSIASLLFVVGSELTRRRRVQKVATERAFKTSEGAPSEAYVAGSPNTDYQAGYFEKVEPTSATIDEVDTCTTTRADHPERSRLLDCAK